MKKFKLYLSWLVLGLTIFFIAKTFKAHWQEVVAIRINGQGWMMLFWALIATTLAHVFSGWVWSWILSIFNCSLQGLKAIRIYLITNIGKYLPGNVWHFYGRINAVSKTGSSMAVASLSVLLEPLLMAAAALLVALISGSLGLIKTAPTWQIVSLQIMGLNIVLIGIHPRIINPVLRKLSRSKGQKKSAKLNQYPLFPLLGELGFLLLRGTGFLFVCMALMSVDIRAIPQLLSVFSFAWLLGLIVPGAPGGMGVFEATAIASLDASQFPPALVLTVVALFRLVSILAEAIAALMAWLSSELGRG
jgi:uncharacterized membrane protein YbhN (UPF0104 family)